MVHSYQGHHAKTLSTACAVILSTGVAAVIGMSLIEMAARAADGRIPIPSHAHIGYLLGVAIGSVLHVLICVQERSGYDAASKDWHVRGIADAAYGRLNSSEERGDAQSRPV